MNVEGSPFIARSCRIAQADGSGEAALEIRFYVPQTSESGATEAVAAIESPYFKHRIRMGGVDDVQAFFCLFDPVLAYLKRKCGDLNLKVWWLRDGDLDSADFWAYQP